MKIKTVEIRNFKSIKEMCLNLGDINVLIGANGSGKSNFISFFRFLNHILEDNLKYYVASEGGPDSILYFGRKFSSEIYLKIDFGKKESYISRVVPAGEALLIKESKDVSKLIRKAFTSSRIYHFHDTGATAKVKGTCHIDDNKFLRSDASNLAAVLYYLQEKHKQIFTT